MITESIVKLPDLIIIKDKEFEFSITHDGNDGLMMAYTIVEGFDDDLMWKNTFTGEHTEYLFFKEGIKTDADFEKALKECHDFLQKNNLTAA